MLREIQKINRGGQGYFVKVPPSGRARVENEGGDFLFYSRSETGALARIRRNQEEDAAWSNPSSGNSR